MKKKGKMYGMKEGMKPSMKSAKMELGMNMGGKTRFLNFNLKDNTVSGEVKSISPNCANMG